MPREVDCGENRHSLSGAMGTGGEEGGTRSQGTPKKSGVEYSSPHRQSMKADLGGSGKNPSGYSQ